MLNYAERDSRTAVPPTSLPSTSLPSLCAMPNALPMNVLLTTGAVVPGALRVKQGFWQPKAIAFPAASVTHHNSMDLGTVITDAGTDVRTAAGRPPRGVPR